MADSAIRLGSARARDVSLSVEIRSSFDSTIQLGVLRIPIDVGTRAIPLVVAPHPFGWSIEEDHHGGYPTLRAARHPGWRGLASRLDIAVFQPQGHHRLVEHCSLGYAGVVRDVPQWIEAIEDIVKIDRNRVYAGGLSMGALEAVLMVGSYPATFAAGFAINPVFDVVAWYDDLASTQNVALRQERNDVLIAQEIGGTPADVPMEYHARGAFSVLDGLRRMPLAISWSPDDLVVPRQGSRHGKRLHDELKRLDPEAPVLERRRRSPRLLSDRERWAIHESADYGAAAAWLLTHRRRANAAIRSRR